MRKLTFTIAPEQDAMTLKAFLRGYLKLSARVVIKQKYTLEGLLINGKHARVIDILHAGDRLEIHLPEEKADYEPADLTLEVMFENEDFLIVNKPANMPVHPSSGHDRDSLLNAVAFYMEQKGERFKFRPLYRLDKDTSGIIVLAKHRIAASSSEISKEYFAVVEGKSTEKGSITVPIMLEEGSKIKRSIGGRANAETEFERIAFDGEHSLLRLKLKTGRTHQIRVHMAHLGHPVAGDDLYGGGREHIKRQALFCKKIELANSVLGMEKTFETEYPQDIINAFGDLIKK